MGGKRTSESFSRKKRRKPGAALLHDDSALLGREPAARNRRSGDGRVRIENDRPACNRVHRIFRLMSHLLIWYKYGLAPRGGAGVTGCGSLGASRRATPLFHNRI